VNFTGRSGEVQAIILGLLPKSQTGRYRGHAALKMKFQHLVMWLNERLAYDWRDAALLILLAGGGMYQLCATPQFAANLPQDAFDYAVPAVNYLERGSLTLSCFGKEHPAGHPIGLPILLLPSYVLFGHFIGNGIYTITFCAVATVCLAYLVGQQIAGRLCGTLCGLFLLSHHGFSDFSRKIMAEVPSIFLLLACFWLVLRLRNKPDHPQRITSILLGAVAGLTVAVRTDNMSVLIPLLVILAWGVPMRQVLRRGCFMAVGLVPWLVAIAWYNQIHFTSPFWSGQQYWGNVGTVSRPIFSGRYWTKAGYLSVHPIPTQVVGFVEGNCSAYAKTLMSQVDTTLTFGLFWHSTSPWRARYQFLVGWRSVLGLVGIAACCCWWRRNPSARWVLIWSLVFTSITFVTFASYWWQDERFLLRLVPFLCILNGVGGAWLLTATWKAARVLPYTGIILPVLFVVSPVGCFLYIDHQRLVSASDDNLQLYENFTRADKVMESNAVVITTYEFFRPDIYFVRGKQRICLPFSQTAGGGVIYPTPHSKAVTPYEFTAVERVDALLGWVREGRPLYVFFREPFDGRLLPAEPASLLGTFNNEPRMSVNWGTLTVPCLLRLYPKAASPFSLASPPDR
jgi:hypothetical protein